MLMASAYPHACIHRINASWQTSSVQLYTAPYIHSGGYDLVKTLKSRALAYRGQLDKEDPILEKIITSRGVGHGKPRPNRIPYI